RVEVVHRADRAVVVRVVLGVQRAVDQVVGLAVGLVLALALLVLDHAALLVQHLLVDRAEQVAHAVGLHPQRQVQRGGGHVLEVVGAVQPGGAVHVGGADQLERLEVLAAVVLRAVEHQVLEQVGEAAAAGRFVLAADVVPDVHRHDRRLAVGVHHHAQAIGQGELLVRDQHLAAGRGTGGGIRRGQSGDPEGGGDGHGQGRGERPARDPHRDAPCAVIGAPMLAATGGLYTRPQAIPAGADTDMRHCLVTGANRGLRLAFTRPLLTRGARVVATARHPGRAAALNALAGDYPGRLHVLPLDVAAARSRGELARELALVLDGQPLDLLLNNAGVLHGGERFGQVAEADLETSLRTNAIGPFLLVQALADLLADGGIVANLSSEIGSLALRREFRTPSYA